VKIEFSRQIFEKYSNVDFHENPSSGSQVVPCKRKERERERETDRQTDKHDKVNKGSFLQFCESNLIVMHEIIKTIFGT